MKKIKEFLKKRSYKRKLMGYSLFLSIIPVLVVGSLSSYITSKNIQNEVDEHHQFVLEQIQSQSNNFLKNLNISSIEIATDPAVEQSIKAGPFVENIKTTFEMVESIRRYRSMSPIRFNASIVYNRFDHIYSNAYSSEMLDNYRFDYIVNKYASQSNRSFIVPPNAFDEQSELLLFRPVPMSTPYTEGTLVLHVDVDELTQYTGSRYLGDNSKLMIVNDEGLVIFSPNKEQIGTELKLSPELYQVWSHTKQPEHPVTLNGVDYRLATLQSSYNRWTYIVMTPMTELMSESRYIQFVTWVVVGSLSLLWMIIAYFGSHRMYFPVKRLVSSVGFVDKASKEMGDELGVVGSYVSQLTQHNREMKGQLKAQLPYLRQSLLMQILTGEMSDREIRRTLANFHLQLRGTFFYVCIVEVDDIDKFTERFLGENGAIIHFGIRKMIEELCQAYMSCMTLTAQRGQVVLIVGTREENAADREQQIYETTEQIRASIKEYFRFSVSVAIGTPRQDYNSLNISYQDAEALLKYRLLMGHDVTITRQMVDDEKNLSRQMIVQQQKDIVFHVVHGNIDEANRQLSIMIQEIRANKMNPKTALSLFSYLIGELDYLIHQVGSSLHDMFEIDLYHRLHSLNALHAIENWLSRDVFPTIKHHLDQQNVSKQTKTIREVLLFIHEHFDQDLSLQYVADQFDLSPSYLSRIFKEETKSNFGDYLRELRMKKAQEWLEHTEMPIKEIAKKLGYASVQNFSRIFKQRLGTSPGAYRKNKRHN